MASAKRERQRGRKREAETAQIEVVCPGMLEVLSVGKGDVKLTVGGDDPNEIAKAKRIIEEMLAKGYGIFVETDKGLTRVKRFNPKRMSYVISELADEPAGAAPAKGGRRVKDKEVAVAGSRATAIGRTAGG